MDVRRRLNEGRRSGLFARIYSTFVITVVAATVVAAVGTWLVFKGLSDEWVADTLEVLEEKNDDLVADLGDTAALEVELSGLSKELGTQVGVYGRRGRRIAGLGPKRMSKRARRFSDKLGRGHPVVHEPEARPNNVVVLFPLAEPDTGETVAVVLVRPKRRRPALFVAIGSVVILTILGVGARMLASSLARRLGRLEGSAGRIARGELGHRVPVDNVPARDELDHLGIAFNDMAGRLQKLIVGQKTLLANVSHELRTPVARVKVQLEILQERAENLATAVAPDGDKDLARVRKGLNELMHDMGEVESLISDLLTSGRLELRADEGASIERSRVELAPLLRRVADRVGARVQCEDGLEASIDAMLVERLISNLVSNARRHCPDGDIAVVVTRTYEDLIIAVEDEGPGVPPEHREQIFEPFVRLDAARSRDAGGVGLGLYLSRQIAHAHGGELIATDRDDGNQGARMQITLPRRLT